VHDPAATVENHLAARRALNRDERVLIAILHILGRFGVTVFATATEFLAYGFFGCVVAEHIAD